MALTRTQIYDTVTELLDGRQMNQTLFGTLLNLEKNTLEQERPWQILKKEDSSETILSSNTFETSHSLPTRFARPYAVTRKNGVKAPLVLRSGNNYRYVTPIDFANRQEYKDDPNRMAIDYANSVYYLTGDFDQSYTAYLSYIEHSSDLDNDGDLWVFPGRFHAILAYLVAINEKGIDYDSINRENNAEYRAIVDKIKDSMVEWDAQLALDSINI